MDEFNNEELNKTSVEEQISNLEREINGAEEMQTPEIEEPAVPETTNVCEPKKCKCNCGLIVGICGLILGIAAVVLFILMYMGIMTPKCAEEENENTVFDKPVVESEAQDVAYVDLDTLLLTYNYAIKLQEDLAMEQKKAESTIQNRMKKFEEMYNAYAEKARTGMFLSAASQQAQQNELEKEQQSIENLQTSLSNQLLEKQSSMNQEIYDTVVSFVGQYCKGRYKVVLGNMGGVNIVYAQEGMNITNDVVTKLNQRYGGFGSADEKN